MPSMPTEKTPYARRPPWTTANLVNTIDFKLFMLILKTASSIRKAAIRDLADTTRRTKAEIREMKELQKHPPVKELTEEERSAKIREILGIRPERKWQNPE